VRSPARWLYSSPKDGFILYDFSSMDGVGDGEDMIENSVVHSLLEVYSCNFIQVRKSCVNLLCKHKYLICYCILCIKTKKQTCVLYQSTWVYLLKLEPKQNNSTSTGLCRHSPTHERRPPAKPILSLGGSIGASLV
jgi:hypothetical protein